jgi:hypothetical protein
MSVFGPEYNEYMEGLQIIIGGQVTPLKQASSVDLRNALAAQPLTQEVRDAINAELATRGDDNPR